MQRKAEPAPVTTGRPDASLSVGTPDWEAAAVWGQLHRFPKQPAIPETRALASSDANTAPGGMDKLFDQGLDEADQAAEEREQARLGTDPVQLDVTWSGKFGGDLTADVIVRGAIDPATVAAGAWKRNAKPTQVLGARYVADPDAEEGARDQRLQTSIQLPRRSSYELIIDPLAGPPQDRYRRTTHKVEVDANAERASTEVRLAINRWNLENVDDVWEQKGINRELAADTVSVPLCRRRVTVNRLVVPRVQQTDALFRQLPRATQDEIVDSIAIMGGYAKRTTTTGHFSNHSIGCAIDINYNKGTRQNHHFHTRSDKAHLSWVQEVIRTDPEFADFRFFGAEARDQVQLQAANAFNTRFPGYLAELVEPGDQPDSGTARQRERLTALRAQLAALSNTPAADVIASISTKDLESAIAAVTDATDKKALKKVRKYWKYTRAWLVGAPVEDIVDKRDETLRGMVPIHEKLLQIFLDAGWGWGGNWTRAKDYMHFEDEDAMRQVMNQEPAE